MIGTIRPQQFDRILMRKDELALHDETPVLVFLAYEFRFI
jgi:hypothetical protein